MSGISRKADALMGLRDGAAAAIGGVPYGLVMGVAAANAGLTQIQAAGLSAFVFAGLSQLAAVELLEKGTPVLVVIATALIINSRFTMYSASIAPHFERLSRTWRLLCPFFLIGPVYAIALSAFQNDKPDHYVWYFMGLALPAWALWIGGTVTGMVVGDRIPTNWHLDFAVPLIFIAIMVQFLEDGATITAAIVSGVVAVAVAGLPLNMGLFVASIVGMGAGLFAEGRV